MKKILTLLPRILFVVMFLLMFAITVATAYIVFAPDSWPKPFYLVYWFPTAAEAASGENPEGEATPEATEMPEVEPGMGIMIDTGTKIVNLLDPTGRKYLRATVVLEFAPPDPEAYHALEGEAKTEFETEFKTEVDTKLPVVNDVIISLLANQTFESVYTAQGKEDLRQEILERTNAQLAEYHIISVYFTEFVVQ